MIFISENIDNLNDLGQLFLLHPILTSRSYEKITKIINFSIKKHHYPLNKRDSPFCILEKNRGGKLKIKITLKKNKNSIYFTFDLKKKYFA